MCPYVFFHYFTLLPFSSVLFVPLTGDFFVFHIFLIRSVVLCHFALHFFTALKWSLLILLISVVTPGYVLTHEDMELDASFPDSLFLWLCRTFYFPFVIHYPSFLGKCNLIQKILSYVYIM